MRTKDAGAVFLFDGDSALWITRLKYGDSGIRGYVINGNWYFEYDGMYIKSCRSSSRMVDDPTQWGGWNWKQTIHWDDPVSVVERKLIAQIPVPRSMVEEYSEDYYWHHYDEIIEWARNEHKHNKHAGQAVGV